MLKKREKMSGKQKREKETERERDSMEKIGDCIRKNVLHEIWPSTEWIVGVGERETLAAVWLW